MDDQFFRGFLAAGCLVIGLFFWRFYRRDRDRLFSFFAWSFWLMGADRIVLAVTHHHGVFTALPYWARAFAYFLIIVAVIDKNVIRGQSSKKKSAP